MKEKVLFVLSLVCVFGFVLNSVPATYASDGSVVVWSEPVGDDFEIFGSFGSDTGWGDAVRLVSAEETDILACAMPIAAGNANDSAATDEAVSALVVWTKMISFEESYLTWLVWTDGVKPGDPSTFETGFDVNTGASLVKDVGGTIWLSWAAFDGVDDDIYVARWTGQGWSEPQQVNTADDLPDIQANLGLSADGRPWLSWMGLGDEGYQRYFSRHDGAGWVEEVPLPASKTRDFEKLMGERLESLPTLPDHVGEPTKACMTHLNGHIVQSLRYPEPIPPPAPGSDEDSLTPTPVLETDSEEQG